MKESKVVKVATYLSDDFKFYDSYVDNDYDSFVAMVNRYCKFFEKFSETEDYDPSYWHYPAVYENGEMTFKILEDGSWDELLSIVA